MWQSFAEELLGWVALERGDWDEAGSLMRKLLHASKAMDDYFGIANCLEALAGVAGGRGDATRGAMLLGAAEMVHERFGCALPPPGQPWRARTLAAVRAVLDDNAFRAAFDTGRRMTLEVAVAYSMLPEDVAVSEVADEPTSSLSKRELEVLRLIADGKSNQEIATALFISPNTTAHHVTSILNKLGLESRAAAAAYAVRHGLV
jgi:non-specific serine/threonine protein kinase